VCGWGRRGEWVGVVCEGDVVERVVCEGGVRVLMCVDVC